MLTDKKIQDEAGLSTAWRNGCSYFKNGMVTKLIDNGEGNFAATVKGSRNYSISIQLGLSDLIHSYHCSCPAFSSYGGACKHIIAVLKAVQERLELNSIVDRALIKLTEHPLARGLSQAEPQAQSAANKIFQIEDKPKKVSLHPAVSELLGHFDRENTDPGEMESAITQIKPVLYLDAYSYRSELSLEFTIGQKKLYVVKDLTALADAVRRGVSISFGAGFAFHPKRTVFDSRSEALMALLLRAYEDERQLSRYSYNVGLPSFGQKRGMKLCASRLETVLDIQGDEPIGIRMHGQPTLDVPIIKGPPPLKAEIKRGAGVLEVTLNAVHDGWMQPLLPDSSNYYCSGAVYRAGSAFKANFEPFVACLEKCKKPVIAVPDSQGGRVMESLLPALRSIADVSIDKKIEEKYDRIPLRTVVYLDRYQEGISARIEHHYGERKYCGVTEAELCSATGDDRILLRQHREERGVVKSFLRAGFRAQRNTLVQEDEEGVFTFVSRILPSLKETTEVYCSDEFNSMGVRRPVQLTTGIRLSEKGLLEMHFEIPGMTLNELAEILRAYNKKKRYHRLQDGTFVSLAGAEVQGAAELLEHLHLTEADLISQAVELPKYRALYLDSLLRENKGVRTERNSAFKKLVQDIIEPEDLEYPVPEGILGSLREYQKTGFRWLKSLAYYGLGGILADDMGLGKTLQVITFILSEKTESAPPSLVVAPTSLVYNWQEEVRKFAPQLKTAVILGTPEERKAQLEAGREADLVITSYGLLKRDIDYYHTHQFQYCIIDEAQHIKNPATLGAKTVKAIKAKSYFALTGTPIENALTELWSLFDFLMPGYLHNHSRFKSTYETPIVKNQDPRALRDLSRHIRPFVLRRMKLDVLKELPDKIEGCMVNRMTPEQGKLYAAHLAQAQKEFQAVLREGGFDKGQIKILALLTRLRQLCCHPGLFLEGYAGGSGKLEMLMELVQDAVESGHRILLFSQFTGMLGLIREELDKAKLTHFYLDGGTKAEERIRMVNAFNGGESQVFLISLKAGGTGLNLTGADMVIHYDPWWNPAVEDQATDRAYRIGQNKSVQVMRLITHGTIEERIYALQQKKKALVDSIIQPGESFLSRMSESDIRGLFEE